MGLAIGCAIIESQGGRLCLTPTDGRCGAPDSSRDQNEQIDFWFRERPIVGERRSPKRPSCRPVEASSAVILA
jgi:hypothetical protein